MEVVVDGAGLQSRQQHDRLERGPGRLLRLNRAIHQRMRRVIHQIVPVLGSDAAGEQIGIEGRAAHHGEHFAIARIERHHGAAAILHGQFGYGLQVEIDGQLQGLAGDRFLVVAQHAAFISEAVHFDAPLAVHAHQDVVVLALDAVLADDVALMEARELGRVEFRLAHFADVADDVRGQAVARVKPMLHVDHHQFRKRIGVFVRIDESQFGGRQLLFDRDGLVLRRAAGLETPHARHQAVVVQVQAFGDRLQMLHLQVFAREIEAERGVVVDDHAAVPIQDFAARRQHRNGLDAVFHGAFLIEVGIANLQVPKPGDQEHEYSDHDVLENGDFAAKRTWCRRAAVRPRRDLYPHVRYAVSLERA